jgi:hypothetical protein
MVYRPLSAKNKKPFIHIWDEESSPRYHPNYVFKLERSNLPTSLYRANGLTRR